MLIKTGDYNALVDIIESYHTMCKGKDKDLYLKAVDIISGINERVNSERDYKAKFMAEKRKKDPKYGKSAQQIEAHERTVAKVKKELGIDE